MPKPFAPKNGEKTFENFRAADHFGSTVAITVSEYIPAMETVHGERKAIKADVTLVDGLFAGKDFGDVFIFDAAIVNELMDDDGSEPVVAKIVSYMARGKECAKLTVPTADAWTAAEALYKPAAASEKLPF
ncbi:MAG TPA: hypothetical protein VN375_19245 [Vicinamibacteria bacterium]|jgi:hypothetical protein|nr:hypothetical protein [Vicinamibacteria bacterium]